MIAWYGVNITKKKVIFKSREYKYLAVVKIKYSWDWFYQRPLWKANFLILMNLYMGSNNFPLE